MKPVLSIIIPCYNTESTLASTLDSVLQQEFQEWEAIIVNDGSPDNLEAVALKYVDRDSRFNYYKKENGGLGSARNFGIKNAKGEFILPLDSDNQIEKNFALDAISIFKNDLSIGVVHGDAEYFGEKTGIWKVEAHNLSEVLVHNYIDACAIYKKSLWEAVGGYDEKMPYQGHEDWEFWISFGSLGVKFHHLNKIAFKYYVSRDSMIRSFTKEMTQANQTYIIAKHATLFHQHYCKMVAKSKNANLKFLKKVKSKRFVVDLFCSTFFGFKCFKTKTDKLD